MARRKNPVEELEEFAGRIKKCFGGISDFVQENREQIAQVGKLFLDGTIVNHLYQPLAHTGWHLNFMSPPRVLVVDENIDEKMKNHLDSDWESLLSSLSMHYPDRERFIVRACERHRARDYISSVPLFITQIDGICHEHFGASYFSKFGEMRQQIDDSPKKLDPIKQAMFECLKEKPKMLTASSNETAPKRDGIMHGNANFLNYDEEIPSLKAFSLLCFIDTCLNH